ncbi:MAG: WYL domain-containing transcriptional regulator [Nitrospirota bacterium]
MAGRKKFNGLPHKKSSTPGISEKVIRLLEIYTSIAQNKYPSVSRLQEKYDVSKRTIYRYLEIINFIDPIEHDENRKGYKFLSGDRIKKLALSEIQLLMLLTLGETVSHLGEPLKEEFRKFIHNMTNIAKVPSEKKKASIVIKIPDAFETERLNEYFQGISACINEMRSVDIAYKTWGSKEVKQRRVDPYGLVFHEGSWILIGYCHLRDDIRRFALDRIMDLKQTNFYFKPAEGFSLDEHLSHSWGIYDGKDVDVTVRFSSEIAALITRKKRWHPSEKRTILPSGEVELSFTVAGAREIKKWIYTWLPYAEVIKPEWFREQVKEELAKSAKKHA